MQRGPIIFALVGAVALAGFVGYMCHDFSKSPNVPSTQAPASSYDGKTATPMPPPAPRAPAPLVASQAVAQSLPSTPIEPPPVQPPVATPVVNQPNIPASGPTENVIVYVTRTGTKYHSAGCRYLAQSSIPMPLTTASARYGPCSVCNPPPPVSSQNTQVTDQTQTTPDGKPMVAENGSRYGDISPATGKPKTTYVKGYTRKDGTYVRGYYRSK
jgi:hypothetical protein